MQGYYYMYKNITVCMKHHLGNNLHIPIWKISFSLSVVTYKCCATILEKTCKNNIK